MRELSGGTMRTPLFSIFSVFVANLCGCAGNSETQAPEIDPGAEVERLMIAQPSNEKNLVSQEGNIEWTWSFKAPADFKGDFKVSVGENEAKAATPAVLVAPAAQRALVRGKRTSEP